jgi:hypothetical protein
MKVTFLDWDYERKHASPEAREKKLSIYDDLVTKVLSFAFSRYFVSKCSGNDRLFCLATRLLRYIRHSHKFAYNASLSWPKLLPNIGHVRHAIFSSSVHCSLHSFNSREQSIGARGAGLYYACAF